MYYKSLTLICLLIAFLISCSKERVYEGIYEGLQERERILHPSDDPIPQEQRSYDEYKIEREESLK
ncbi:MAG: hypothetical protein ACE5GF_05425 [Thermodesulfobacteriota bacterium]